MKGSLRYERRQIVTNRPIETNEERPAHERVADRYLIEVRERPEQRQVEQIEIVASVHAEPETVSHVGGIDVPLEASLPRIGCTGIRTRERLGIELYTVGSHRRRPTDSSKIRIDEQADPDPLFLQALNNRSDHIGRSIRRPPRLARDFAGPDGNERDLIGPDFVDQIEEIRPRVPLDVVLDDSAPRRQRRGDLPHVLGGDVPRVRARVDGDAGYAGGDADLDSLQDAGNLPASRVAKRGNLVDVDAETRRHDRLPEMFLHGARDL